jgi:hypothetical protein
MINGKSIADIIKGPYQTTQEKWFWHQAILRCIHCQRMQLLLSQYWDSVAMELNQGYTTMTEKLIQHDSMTLLAQPLKVDIEKLRKEGTRFGNLGNMTSVVFGSNQPVLGTRKGTEQTGSTENEPSNKKPKQPELQPNTTN